MVSQWLQKRGKKVDRLGAYALTQLGTSKAESFSEPTMANRVLGFLHANGSSTVSEISSGENIPDAKVVQVLKYLDRNGFVKKVGRES